MKTIMFYGHSDDLVHVLDVRGEEEYGAITRDNELVAATFVVGGIMRVRALYDGCWSFAVGQVGEDMVFPEWPIRFVAAHGYSVRLEIEVPDDRAIVIREAKS